MNNEQFSVRLTESNRCALNLDETNALENRCLREGKRGFVVGDRAAIKALMREAEMYGSDATCLEGNAKRACRALALRCADALGWR